MMKLMDELKGARLSITEAAELIHMHPAHFRRLCRRGVFPQPKRTAKGRPFFDYELLTVIASVLKSGVGLNAEEIVFYRRRSRSGPRKRPVRSCELSGGDDDYLANLAEGLRQVGIPEKSLTVEKLSAALTAIFGQERPELATAIPALAKRLMG